MLLSTLHCLYTSDIPNHMLFAVHQYFWPTIDRTDLNIQKNNPPNKFETIKRLRLHKIDKCQTCQSNLLFSYLSVSVPTENRTLSNVGIVRNTVKLYGYKKSLWFFISFALMAVILLSIIESSKICSVKWFNDIEWAVK